jgi:phosphate-selective porin OprO/OprP
MAVAVSAGVAHAEEDAAGSDRLKKLEEQIQSLQKEIDQLKTSDADLRDKDANLQSAMEQTGVRAYLGPGLIFEDPRNRWRLQISGRAQLDYRMFWPDSSNADTFSIRRARMSVFATVLDNYSVFVEEEFANQATSPAPNNAPIMTFAWVEFGWWKPGLRIRAGQFKPFLGLDNTQLDLQTDFQERALTQSLFQSLIYDRGVMAFGEPIDGLFYSAAVTNGTGQNLDEPQAGLQEAQGDGKDVTTRLVANFAKFFRIDDSVIHFGGTYKQGQAANSQNNPYTAASVQTEAKGVVFFVPEPFNTATGSASNIERQIYDIEGALAWRNFKIQGDYVQTRYSGTHYSPGAEEEFDRKLIASYVSVGWFITGEYYADIYKEGTFVRPRPRNNFIVGEPGAIGLIEFNARYSRFDGSDFNAANSANTGRIGSSLTTTTVSVGTNRAEAFTLALKWQPNLYTRMVVNLIRTNFDTPVTANGVQINREDAVTTRVQVDF